MGVMLHRIGLFRTLSRQNHPGMVDYVAIGKAAMISPKSRGLPYPSGQFFIARDFEYRGVVLCDQKVTIVSDDEATNGTVENAYIVLCGERDTVDPARNIDYIHHYMDEGQVKVTQNIDIIPHEKMLPMTHIEQLYHFEHTLFRHYFKHNDWNRRQLIQRANLYNFIDQSRRCLKKFVKTTKNIRISVIPFYLGDGFTQDRRVSGGERYDSEDFLRSTNWWQYTVTMENLSDEPFELIERQLRILDRASDSDRRSIKSVRGRGVVGKHPIIARNTPFRYTSTMPLPAYAKNGSVWGSYVFESRHDGRSENVDIPKFELSTEILDPDAEQS